MCKLESEAGFPIDDTPIAWAKCLRLVQHLKVSRDRMVQLWPIFLVFVCFRFVFV